MAFDPYASCPCGSGKKFKWCCQPIYGGIDKAFRQHQDGQHEAALRTMNEVIAANPNNPEAYGRQAMLLYDLGKAEEAEQALEKAFSINPDYPFGHYLRGQFRIAEGEARGALALFRKAAELYDPEAREHLGSVYARIADLELSFNRPVASRAAVEIAARIDTAAAAEYRQIVEKLFGKQSQFPMSARGEYSYKSPPADTPAEKMAAWKNALSKQTTGRLSDAVKVFEELTTQDPDNAAAWYNLALSRAWLGDNAAALEALDEYVQRETNEKEAAQAWALGEVLRCGEGLEETEADYVAYSRNYAVRNPEVCGRAIQQLSQEGRLVGAKLHEQDGIFTAILVEAPAVLVAGAVPTEPPHFAAHLLLVGNLVRISATNRENVSKICQELEQRFADAFGESADGIGMAHFADVPSESLVFPTIEDENQVEDARRLMEKGMADFYEQTWLHRPLRSLRGVPPVDAAGHEVLRKKLRGVIQFIEECSYLQGLPYDFDQLRRKLGLVEPAPMMPGKRDVSAMSAAELAALETDSLADAELEQAYQAAQKLDARELSTAFLKKLVARPRTAEKPDTFPWYGQLIQQAVSDRNLDEALNYVNEGEKADCEHNEGRRRNDYELWRGRIHARRGEVDTAQDVFDRLIARVPDELRYRGTAAEAMLSAKDKDRALRFAQEGLGVARKHQDRDSEQYFLELSEAAQKM